MFLSVSTLLLYFFCVILTGCCALFFSFLLYLYYLHKIHDHLPGPPRSSFIFGHLKDIARCRQDGCILGEYLLDQRMKHGPVYSLFFLHQPVVVIGDPAYVREVYVNNQNHVYKAKIYHKAAFIYGERGIGYGLVTNLDTKSWGSRRHLINPAFHRKSLRSFLTAFNQVCDRFVERMNNASENNLEVTMLKEFGNVTFDVVCQVFFNVSVAAIEDPDSRFPTAVTDYMKGVQDNLESPLSPTLLGIYQFTPFQNATQKKQIDSAKFLRKFAFECISNRLRDIEMGKDVPDDLLNILVSSKGLLSMDDMMDEFVTILIAGQETTANSLAFTLYEIAENPDIEARVLREIEEVLHTKNCVEYEDLSKLKYLGQVFQESLRMHPVGEASSNVILEKELGFGSHKIPKGTMVIAENYVFNYNPYFWENPNIFNPERFDAPETIANFNMLYFPFAVGRHSCIGQTFAKFEVKILLAKLLRKFKFELLPGQTNRMVERLTIVPRDGVMCKVMKR